jgi:RNA polymerase sigma factor (sigma-70 family)
MSPADIRLLELWNTNRDAQAFAEIVSCYSALVYHTARRILGNQHDAEDVAQECFLHLAKSKAPARSSLGGWLHTMATHRSLDRRRSDSRRRQREKDHATQTVIQPEVMRRELEREVDDAIASLPENLRDIVIQHFLLGRKHVEIAEELGLARSTITNQVRDGVERIRKRLAGRGIPVAAAALAQWFAQESSYAAPQTLIAALGRQALSGAPAAGASSAIGLIGILLGAKMQLAAVLAGALLVGLLVIPQMHKQPPPVPASPQVTTTKNSESSGGSIESSLSTNSQTSVIEKSVHIAAATPEVMPTTVTAALAEAARPYMPAATECSVSGFVFDASGVPIAGAEVCIFGGKTFTTRTNELGIYRLYARPRIWVNFLVYAEGYADEMTRIELEGGTQYRRDVHLHAGIELPVRVVDTAGTPLPGVSVNYKPGQVTDANGEILVNGLDPLGAIRINASKSGYESVEKHLKPSRITSGEIESVTLVMQPRLSITLVGCVSNEAGQPMQDVRVCWVNNQVNFSKVATETRSNADGSYRLEISNLGNSDPIFAYLPGYAPDGTRACHLDTNTRIVKKDFILGKGHQYEGTVVDPQGNPLAGIEAMTYECIGYIVPLHRMVYTDERGYFRLKDLPANGFRLHLQKEGWQDISKTVKVDRNEKYVMHPECVILGEVVDAETEEPVSDFKIHIFGGGVSNSSIFDSYQADDGKFIIRDLRSDWGEHSILLIAAGYNQIRVENLQAMPEAQAARVRIALTPLTTTSGQVVDAETHVPIRGVSLLSGVPRRKLL